MGTSDSAEENRRILTAMAARDLLWFVNSCCWLYEPRPRPGSPYVLPFITRDYQDYFFMLLLEVFGVQDLVCRKSRDMGVSWMVMTTRWWQWRFSSLFSNLVLSRKEEYVDGKDPNALLWKFDFIGKHVPKWMQSPTDRTFKHRVNLINGSTVDGEATNKFAGVGGRKANIDLDEFSMMENQQSIFSGLQTVTNSRVYIFTPRGIGNTAYQLWQNSKMRKVTLHWTLDREKVRGLYRVPKDGEIQILDKEYWTPERRKSYVFVPVSPRGAEFKFRSIAYDQAEIGTEGNPSIMAEQWDCSFEGSGSPFWTESSIAMAQSYIKPPILVGELAHDLATAEVKGFQFNRQGHLALWFNLDDLGIPPPSEKFVLGVDVAMGTQHSNSVISAFNETNGDQVAEYVCSTIEPHILASYAVAMAKWFNNAFLIWEVNNGGRIFGKHVLRLNYKNIYYRKKHEETKTPEKTNVPGWWNVGKAKVELLKTMMAAMTDQHITLRSQMCLNECREYRYVAGGGVEHSSAYETEDPSGAIANHGDRVIGAALAVKVIMEGAPEQKQIEPMAPYGSIKWIMDQDALREEDDKYTVEEWVSV